MSKIKKLLLLTSIVAVAAIIINIIGVDQIFSVDQLKQMLNENKLLAIVVFCLVFSAANLLYIPGFLFVAAPVSLFSVREAFVIVYIACIVCSSISYYFVSFFGNDLLRTFDNRLSRWAFENIDKRPIFSVIVLRTLMQTTPALNYTLSLSGIKFSNYILGSMIGLIIPIFIYCAIFALILNNNYVF
ncbi:TVP38/TMEM64 family protein [Halobacteriovorax sp. HLS]|uniref:TVP38/TMEM64 family protein n=1 Tax=Halobacteriovorax sp. HLS TaxID=2234000 RepID=UPI000FDABFFF|nr:VTT domain-containing protein [Halobacteriovorax sp. HLS]